MSHSGQPDLRHDIEQSNAAFAAAIAARDLDRIADFYAEDAVLLLEGMPEQRGRASIRAFFGVAFDVGLKTMEFSTLDVRSFGGGAVEQGTYVMTADGALRSQVGRYVVLHRREEDGAWRALYDITQTTGEA